MSVRTPFGFMSARNRENQKLWASWTKHQPRLDLVSVFAVVCYMSCRPNADLTPEEKKAKKEQKAQLKQAVRRRKLQVRLVLAEERRDDAAVADTMAQLQILDEKQAIHASNPLDPQGVPSVYAEPLDRIYNSLASLMQGTSKEQRMLTSKSLLQNMSKGTQQLNMFSDYEALCGYTRLKFFERARLVATLLDRVNDVSGVSEKVLHGLGGVKSVISIGCGPGCDAVGVGLYRQQQGGTLQRAVLMDWAMKDWAQITAPLKSIVVPSLMKEMVWEACNVVKDWDHSENTFARTNLEVDLVVTCYLLTETRGKWESFYIGLLNKVPPGTLFLFVEPTAWQLHRLIEMEYLDYWWIDSSLNRPQLQTMERRIGPAALIGIRR